MSKNQYSFLDCLTDIEKAILEKGHPFNHYAIFNNAIEHNLIQIINNGGKEFTDKLFFELLAEEPAYLATVLFQNKIKEWQEICQWHELHEKKEVAIAKSNLNKIGRVLARSGAESGSPEKLPLYTIRIEYYETLRFLNKFFAGAGEKHSSTLLVKTYPEWKHAFITETGRHEHWSVTEIALRLTLFRLSSRKKIL